MKDNARLELLVEAATDYSKTSYELIKLKMIDKVSDSVSSLIPHSITFIIVLTFLLFCNLGIVFWLSEILGKIYLGFFVVGAFYAVLGIIMHFFMHGWLKKLLCNSIIVNLLK
jgi:fatty acid desaturase